MWWKFAAVRIRAYEADLKGGIDIHFIRGHNFEQTPCVLTSPVGLRLSDTLCFLILSVRPLHMTTFL